MNLSDNLPMEPVADPERRVPKASREIIGEKEVPPKTKLDTKVPWYRQDGAKRGVGCFFMITGGVMTFFPATVLIGNGLFVLGSLIGGVGIVSAAKKSGEDHNEDKGLWATILSLLQKLIDALKNYKK